MLLSHQLKHTQYTLHTAHSPALDHSLYIDRWLTILKIQLYVYEIDLNMLTLYIKIIRNTYIWVRAKNTIQPLCRW